MNDILIKGLPVCGGYVIGPAKVIKSFLELNKVKDGCILITKTFSPDYTIIADKVKGIISEMGNSTCHLAIVAREFNIPCIVQAKNATDLIKDGSLITLDSYRGIVYKGKIVGDIPNDLKTVLKDMNVIEYINT